MTETALGRTGRQKLGCVQNWARRGWTLGLVHECGTVGQARGVTVGRIFAAHGEPWLPDCVVGQAVVRVCLG
eukprot:1161627-Pelagomonas_calceolata.AAC.10